MQKQLFRALFYFFIFLFIMNKILIAFLSLSTLFFVGCEKTSMTDADMATQYGLSIEEFQEQKEAAARMNMSIEDHLGM
jgi:hypothetical protein